MNKRIFFNINNEKIFLRIFILLYIENISQQQKNAKWVYFFLNIWSTVCWWQYKFKNRKTTSKCRFCFILINERRNLNYNFIVNERFHYQIFRIKTKFDFIKQISKKESYDTKWEMALKNSPFTMLFFAFDIIFIRSENSTYYKYFDIIRQLHFLLLIKILIIFVVKLYALKFK